MTGLPPAYLFLLEPELVGEPKLLAAEDDPPTCFRGAFAPTAITDNSVKHENMERTSGNIVLQSKSRGRNYKGLTGHENSSRLMLAAL